MFCSTGAEVVSLDELFDDSCLQGGNYFHGLGGPSWILRFFPFPFLSIDIAKFFSTRQFQFRFY